MIFNCVNRGELSGGYVGGAVGFLIGEPTEDQNVYINSFYNFASIEGDIAAGGVIGRNKNCLCVISQVYIDNILITGYSVAGIIGSNTYDVIISEAAVHTNLETTNSTLECFSTAKMISDSYFIGNVGNVVLSHNVYQCAGVFTHTTHKYEYDKRKDYYGGFTNEKWVVGVNNGTAGLRRFLAVGTAAPVEDVETHLKNLGYTGY